MSDTVGGLDAKQPELREGELFGRIYSLVVGLPDEQGNPSSSALEITDLDIDFRVHKNLKPEPNTCEIKVYNLGPDVRETLRNAKKTVVVLKAGYLGTGMSTIFKGDCRSAWSVHANADWVTTLRTGDGAKAIKGRVNLSFAGSVNGADVLKDLAKTMGLSGKLLDKFSSTVDVAATAVFPDGLALSGNAWKESLHTARSMGLELSIQDGALQALPLHKPLDDLAIEISSDSGMLSSPQINADGRVTVETLLIPGLRPGVKLSLDSITTKGGYRCEEIEFSGQTRGNDWSAKITCRRY